jgi:ABC-type arginine transport system ATPase subunit
VTQVSQGVHKAGTAYSRARKPQAADHFKSVRRTHNVCALWDCTLARAMVLEPKVFLLDEITSALDPDTVLNVVEAMRALRTADRS